MIVCQKCGFKSNESMYFFGPEVPDLCVDCAEEETREIEA